VPNAGDELRHGNSTEMYNNAGLELHNAHEWINDVNIQNQWCENTLPKLESWVLISKWLSVQFKQFRIGQVPWSAMVQANVKLSFWAPMIVTTEHQVQWLWWSDGPHILTWVLRLLQQLYETGTEEH
jgi:hypothetical protein